MFAVGVIILLSLIYFDTANFIENQTNYILKAELHRYQIMSTEDQSKSIENDINRDIRKINIYGIFTPEGRKVSGNAAPLPKDLIVDGTPHFIASSQSNFWDIPTKSVLEVAEQLPNHNIIFIGRKQIQLDEIRHIIIKALGSAVIVILVGTFIGIKLSINPVRRINEIQSVSQKIINGDINLRLPIAGNDDELDMLAVIVNKMLDEIAQRILDIKASTDSIAHDLRTPLTHLRAMLNRLLHSSQGTLDHQAIEQAIDETDILLFRFRAILRISEISGSMQKAMFESFDFKDILMSIQEIYAPLAEEKNVSMQFQLPTQEILINGDKALLFEAVLNLVDNAIKFSPIGGYVIVSAFNNNYLLQIENNGLGIPQDEITKVIKPFYRCLNTKNLVSGNGVGLSIVSTIMNLHGLNLIITSNNGITIVKVVYKDNL